MSESSVRFHFVREKVAESMRYKSVGAHISNGALRADYYLLLFEIRMCELCACAAAAAHSEDTAGCLLSNFLEKILERHTIGQWCHAKEIDFFTKC